MVFCLGNHEDRFDRLANDNPELEGFVGTETLNLSQYGWEVSPFLKPIEIEDIWFAHYFANPFTGKPYSGRLPHPGKGIHRRLTVAFGQRPPQICIHRKPIRDHGLLRDLPV
jgi:hypothetical protein